MGALVQRLDAVRLAPGTPAIADGSRIEALDTAGAWVLQRLLQRLRGEGAVVTLRSLSAPFAKLLDVVEKQLADQVAHPPPAAQAAPGALERTGRGTVAVVEEVTALLAFIGEIAATLARCIAHPSR